MSDSFHKQKVSELVRQHIDRSRILERFGIDFCCGGSQSLGDACTVAGANLDEVCLAIEKCDESNREPEAVEWTEAPLSVLIDHIVSHHHAYLCEELPRLEALMCRVVDAHGEKHPRLKDLGHVFSALHNELTAHMMKEEQILFPIVKQLERIEVTGEPVPQFHCGSVNNPITAMEHEHDSAGQALRQMRRLTDGFEPPDDACNGYRALLAGLAQLETDLHLHIHKENNILFPRAAKLEASLTARA